MRPSPANAAGEALQDAGYEIHDLLMEEDGLVSADLERPDGATDEEHFHEAAAIIWEHLDDNAQQAEIRIRSDDDVDRIETYSAAELNELHDEMPATRHGWVPTAARDARWKASAQGRELSELPTRCAQESLARPPVYRSAVARENHRHHRGANARSPPRSPS